MERIRIDNVRCREIDIPYVIVNHADTGPAHILDREFASNVEL